MKILAFSDVHHSLARAEAIGIASNTADLVIGAGDFCNMRQDLSGAMSLLYGLAAPMLAVPGNAESFEELTAAATGDIQVLHGTGVEIDGLKFFGLGYAVPETPFGDWSCDLSEAQAAEMLAQCEEADVLILHSPPKGLGDETSGGVSIGSVAIREAIERIQPQLAVCGHVHDSWGRSGQIGKSEVVNLGPGVNWFDLTPD